MIGPTIAFLEYLRNNGADLDADFLREIIILMTWLPMEAEVSERAGAGRCERSEEHRTHGNDCRERSWHSGVAEIPLRTPNLRRGSCSGLHHVTKAGHSSSSVYCGRCSRYAGSTRICSRLATVLRHLYCTKHFPQL